MEILKWLESSRVTSEYEVLDYKSFRGGFYIKIKVSLKDGSVLFIKEYSDQNERNYAYHWQDINGKLLVRWDNAPHYPNLFNSPHHKHTPNQILSSSEILVKDILAFIKGELNK